MRHEADHRNRRRSASGLLHLRDLSGILNLALTA
jgi:hypothetical protein